MWLRRLIMRNEIKMNEDGLQNNNDKLGILMRCGFPLDIYCEKMDLFLWKIFCEYKIKS